jgi:hypothetical protein
MNARMTVNEFGEALLRSGDLDPIYIMLTGAKLEEPVLKRWMLAYWCFYHAGVASTIATAPDFYSTFERAVSFKWPRGTERRHFRGKACDKTLEFFRREYPNPESAVDFVRAPTFAEVSERAQLWPLFGPWISFKVADMLDRVMGWRVDFSQCALGIYSEPAAGAAIVAQQRGITGLQPGVETTSKIVDVLTREFAHHYAPPFGDRTVNVQEVETILCKYKSHLNGHYPVGKDTREIKHALAGWGPLADKLKGHLP